MKIKVMSWNINGGKDLDGICRHIAEENPDVLGLQEVVANYLGPKQGHELDTAIQIHEKLKMEYGIEYNFPFFNEAFISDRHVTRHMYGNVILSRLPSAVYSHWRFGKNWDIALSSEEEYLDRPLGTVPRDAEPRMANVQTYSTKINPEGALLPAGALDTLSYEVTRGKPDIEDDLRVVDVHLACSEKFEPTMYTKIQMPNLMELIGDGKRTILMGDFNMDFYNSENPEVQEYRAQLESVMKNTDPEQKPTWSLSKDSVQHHHEAYHSRGKEGEGGQEYEPQLLTHRLDQIWFGEGINLVEGSFHLGESMASDHKSLICEFEA
jgi:endonuclease/exonuclease/phosphatase family metal-dependent hydrolase